MVIMQGIGQLAWLSPTVVMADYGEPSETERVLVCNDRLATLNMLKTQSNPHSKDEVTPVYAVFEKCYFNVFQNPLHKQSVKYPWK